jgi:DNA-binding beta-propeller fold protein YncE
MGRRRWVILAVAAAVAVATVAARTAFDAAASLRGPEVIAAGQGPGPLALSPDGRFLYAADFGTFTTRGNTITVIDLTKSDARTIIRVGDYPAARAAPGGPAAGCARC